MADDAEYRKFVLDIGRAILDIQELCRQLGISDGLRELLKCRICGLIEDAAFDGMLIIYRERCGGCGYRFAFS